MRAVSCLSIAVALGLCGCPSDETPCEPLVVEGPLHPIPTPMFSISVHTPTSVPDIGPESQVRRLSVDLGVPVPVALVHEPAGACVGWGYAACTMLLGREELLATEPGGTLSHGGTLLDRFDQRIVVDLDGSPPGDLYFVWLEDPPAEPVLDGSIRAELAACRPPSGSMILLGSVLRPAPICGNGLVEDGEPCDDGDTDAMDGCRSVSKLVDATPRQLCEVEKPFCDPDVAWVWRAWSCAGQPSVCESAACDAAAPGEGCTIAGASLSVQAYLRGRHAAGEGEAHRIEEPEHGVDCACREEAGGALCSGCSIEQPCAAVDAVPGEDATFVGWDCSAAEGARCRSMATASSDHAVAWFESGASGLTWRGPAVGADRAPLLASVGPDGSSAAIEDYAGASGGLTLRALVLRGPDGVQTAALNAPSDVLALAHDPDGGVIVVAGLWGTAHVLGQLFTKAEEAHDAEGARDLVVVRLDATGALTGSWQQGLEIAYDARQAAAGSTRDAVSGAPLTVVAAQNDENQVTDVVALDTFGDEVWFRSLGPGRRVEALSQGGPAVALVASSGGAGSLEVLGQGGKSLWSKEFSWPGGVSDRPAVAMAADGSVAYVGPFDGERAALVLLDAAGEVLSVRPIAGGDQACRAFLVALGGDAAYVAHATCGGTKDGTTVVSRWPLGDGAPEWVERLGGPGPDESAHTVALGVDEGALRLLGAFRGAGAEPAVEVRLAP